MQSSYIHDCIQKHWVSKAYKLRNAHPAGWVKSMKFDLRPAGCLLYITSNLADLYWAETIHAVRFAVPAKNSSHEMSWKVQWVSLLLPMCAPAPKCCNRPHDRTSLFSVWDQLLSIGLPAERHRTKSGGAPAKQTPARRTMGVCVCVSVCVCVCNVLGEMVRVWGEHQTRKCYIKNHNHQPLNNKGDIPKSIWEKIIMVDKLLPDKTLDLFCSFGTRSWQNRQSSASKSIMAMQVS